MRRIIPSGRLRLGAAMLAGLALAACSTPRQAVVREGFPPAYADGFDDGCHSGRKAAGNVFEQARRDAARIDTDRSYARGWAAGFRQCEAQERDLRRQSRIGFERQGTDAAR